MRPAIRQAVGDWLREFAAWNWFVTLTFRDQQTPERGLDAVKWWLRVIARDVVREHVTFAYATRIDPTDGVIHAHLLLGWNRRSLVLTPELGDGLWKRAPSFTGQTEIKLYQRGQDAPGYLTRLHDYWDVNYACPRRGRCGRKGCEVAPGAW